MSDLEPEALSAAQALLVRDAERFELRPLIEQLAEMGYSRDDLLFESALAGRSASIIKGLRFRNLPVRCAVITVHLGLLGDNTLLPSYFFHAADRSPDPERFYDFVRFFDHRLIEGLFEAVHPELSTTYADWGSVLKSFFRMAVPASPSTLQWIVQLDFPELGVRVRRWTLASATEGRGFLTREAALDGTLVLGQSFTTEQDGFVVDLTTEDEIDMRGQPQAERVLERLRERLLPRLSPFHIPLLVRLTVLWHESWAHVDGPPPMQRTFLGYERLDKPRPRRARHETGGPLRHCRLRGRRRRRHHRHGRAFRVRPEKAVRRGRAFGIRPEKAVRHTTVMFRGVTGWDQPVAPARKG